MAIAALFLASFLLVSGMATSDQPVIKVYPGSIELCSGHVTGAPDKNKKPGAHILWTAYTTPDPPDQVVRHYTKALGSANHRREAQEDVWRFPTDKPERVLSITAVPGPLPVRECRRPPDEARTIVMMSTMTRPE